MLPTTSLIWDYFNKFIGITYYQKGKYYVLPESESESNMEHEANFSEETQQIPTHILIFFLLMSNETMQLFDTI